MPSVAIPSLDAVFPAGHPPSTLKYFSNGIAPPASGAASLGDRLNAIQARRLRPLFSYANVYGLHADFDSASTSDLTCYRGVFRTGPTTTTIRWVTCVLPAIGSPSAAEITVALDLITDITGGGTTTTTTVSVPRIGTGTKADDLSYFTQDIAVTPDSYYRVQLHRTNLARIVSSSIYELTRSTLDTADFATVNDRTTYYQGGPIIDTQFERLQLSGDIIWRRGHPLGWWTTDLPGDERSRTSATAANLWDQTVGTPTSTSPGWPTHLPYSGSLDSPDVPVIFWAYADCVSGTGTITFRDGNNVTLGTINPVGAATWYAVSGNLTDNTNGTLTEKVDVFFAGDGVNACKVYACGFFMHADTDPYLSEANIALTQPSDNRASVIYNAWKQRNPTFSPSRTALIP